MRLFGLLGAALLLTGCATITYTSNRPALQVSNCIAKGWRKIPSSGYELPVSLSRSDEYYLIDVVLVRDFPTNIPMHSIWAKVRDTSGGSITEYRRNFQIMHKRIDRVVLECQGGQN